MRNLACPGGFHDSPGSRGAVSVAPGALGAAAARINVAWRRRGSGR